jgi:hypothetical protein
MQGIISLHQKIFNSQRHLSFALGDHLAPKSFLTIFNFPFPFRLTRVFTGDSNQKNGIPVPTFHPISSQFNDVAGGFIRLHAGPSNFLP